MIDLLFQLRGLIFSKTAKDTSVLFLGNAASSILGVIFTILAARFLGPANWGVVAGVMGFVGILVAYGDLGLSSGLFRFVSKLWHKKQRKRAKIIQRVLFSLRLMSALALAGVLVLFSKRISLALFKVDEPLLVVFGAAGLLGSLLVDFQIASFQSKLRWKTASVFIALTNLFRLVFLLLVLRQGSFTIMSVALVFFGSSLITFILSSFWEPIHFGLEKNWRKVFKKVVSFSSWMGLNRIVGATSSRLDVLLLLQLSTAFEAGILAAARQLANGIPIIIGSFATVIAPRFATYGGTSLKSFFKKSVLLSMFVSLIIFLGIFVAEPVISLFGPKYVSSIAVFQWLLVALIPFALATPAVNFLIYSLHKPQIIAMLSVFQLPLVLFGNIYFINRLGVFGPVLVLGLWNLSTLLVSYTFVLFYFKKTNTTND